MASAPSDPEKYSIDEMMDRLKARPSEDPSAGELVIRDDGTSAIRVRKRKRRSSQPQKEEAKKKRRARILQVSGALALLLLSGAVVGIGVIYANSVPFRNSLVEKVEASTGASVDLQLFRMNPANAHANNLTLDWPEGNILGKLELRFVKAEIFPASFLGKTFGGPEITARDGILQLRGAGDAARAGNGLAELPVRFGRYSVPKLDVVFGEPSARLGRLSATEASFYQADSGTDAQLRFTGGHLAITGWPELKVDRSLIGIRSDEMEIVTLRLQPAQESARGMLDVSGKIQPLATGDPSTLQITADAFPLAGIAGPELGELIVTRIDTDENTGPGTLSFLPAGDHSASLTLAFRSSLDSVVQIKKFPFLLDLARATRDGWFEQPVFSNNATGTIHRSGSLVRLGNLSLASGGRMAVRGNIAMDHGGLLSGVLEVGLTDSMIASFPSSRLDILFGPPREGFRWVEVSIGGTVSAPEDDFQKQLSAAGREPGASGGSPRSSFEELTLPRDR